VGEWKLVKQKNQVKTQATVSRKKAAEAGGKGPFRLYRLTDDPAETRDLAAQETGKLEEMKAKMEEILTKGRTRAVQ
jgi:hypothetical protein